jgi:anti-sigma28 factor (negative regulator of flagellin synthesis)
MDHFDNPWTVKQRAKNPLEPTATSQPPSGSTNQADEGLSQARLPDPAPNDNAPDDNAIDHLRLEKIEKIKKAIADGTYRVSAEEVARKVMEHMLEPKD